MALKLADQIPVDKKKLSFIPVQLSCIDPNTLLRQFKFRKQEIEKMIC